MNPFHYQTIGADFLASRFRAFLADEMGLGKSKQAVDAACKVGARTIVVVCPASVRPVWHREFQLWWKGTPPDVFVFSYDELVSSPRRRLELMKLQIDVLILDEAHYLKNPTAKRTKAVYTTTGIARNAVYVWALSGTPNPGGHAGELWTHAVAMYGEPLPYDTWVRTYCSIAPSQYSTPFSPRYRIVGNKKKAIPELRDKLSGWMLRRTVDEVLKDLPDITWGELPIEGTKVLLEAGERAAVNDLIGAERKGAWGAAVKILKGTDMARLRKRIGIAKLPAIKQYLADTVAPGEKVVLFAYHTDVIHALAIHFGVNAVRLDGSTTATEREKAVTQFQKPDGPQFFIGQIVAAGTGITLTAARRVLFVEPDWTPGNLAQAVKRVHRIGQDRPVLAQLAYLKDSVDELVVRVALRKAQGVNDTLG